MENQHKKIKGYRDLSQEEIDLMNEGKELAELCGAYAGKLEDLAYCRIAQENVEIDGHWMKLGKDHLQQGFMCLIRSIAKPETF